jgi:hypothetical protein
MAAATLTPILNTIMPMSNTATQSRSIDLEAETHARQDNATLHHIRLTMRDAERFGARVNTRRIWLTPAASCLLLPNVGDLVLASIAGDQGYIVTILERANTGEAAEISVPGDLRVTLARGRLDITAAHGMALDSGSSLETRATQWSATFQRAQVHCQTMKVCGQTLQNTWRSRTDACDGTHLTIAGRGETYLGGSVRRVQGHDESSAQSLRQLVDRDWSVLADTASLKGRQEVALNAASIQIG